MCQRVHELSKRSVREGTPEHILQRPATAPESAGVAGLAIVVRNLFDRIARKATPAHKTEAAQV